MNKQLKNIQERIDIERHKNRLPVFRYATTEEYNQWMRRYLLTNTFAKFRVENEEGETREKFLYVDEDCYLPRRFGAKYYNALVAPGVHVTFDRDIGHGLLLLPHPYRAIGFHGLYATPTVYSDMEMNDE